MCRNILHEKKQENQIIQNYVGARQANRIEKKSANEIPMREGHDPASS